MIFISGSYLNQSTFLSQITTVMANQGRSILSPEGALPETYFEHVFVSKTLPAQMTFTAFSSTVVFLAINVHTCRFSRDEALMKTN